jgi:F0F1-type ATP synthase membrane subunit b/b'
MRMIRQMSWINLSAGIAIAVLAVPITAAAQTSQVPSTTETIFRWLNFVFVFGVGGWWAWRKLKGVFQRRADQIAATIAEAEAALRSAQARLRAAEEKLAGLDRESTEMRQRARLDSAAEAGRIRDLAQEEAGRIERAADAEIAAAELAAENWLREMAIDRTIERARDLVRQRLTPEIDARLVRRFVEALDRAGGAE